MTDLEYQKWFREIYITTHPIVKRAGKCLLASLCPPLSGELEDLIGEAYLVMHKKREKLIHHPNVTGWLIVALKYIILKKMRKWARNRDAIERLKRQVESEAYARKVNLDFGNSEEMEILRETLGRENFELLRAYHVDGVPIDELALRAGKSVNAIYMKLSRLRKRSGEILRNGDLKTMITLWLAMNFINDWFK